MPDFAVHLHVLDDAVTDEVVLAALMAIPWVSAVRLTEFDPDEIKPPPGERT